MELVVLAAGSPEPGGPRSPRSILGPLLLAALAPLALLAMLALLALLALMTALPAAAAPVAPPPAAPPPAGSTPPPATASSDQEQVLDVTLMPSSAAPPTTAAPPQAAGSQPAGSHAAPAPPPGTAARAGRGSSARAPRPPPEGAGWLAWTAVALAAGALALRTWRRRRPRCASCGRGMRRLDREAAFAELDMAERTEHLVGDVVYTVWRCDACGQVEKVGTAHELTGAAARSLAAPVGSAAFLRRRAQAGLSIWSPPALLDKPLPRSPVAAALARAGAPRQAGEPPRDAAPPAAAPTGGAR